MNLADAYELLATCQAFDRRTVGEVDAAAWHTALHDLDLDDCRSAVTMHYAQHTDWVMPAHVRAGVRRIRTDRLDRAPLAVHAAVPDADPDDVPRWLVALRTGRHRTASGQRSLDPAIARRTFRDMPQVQQ